MFNNTELTNHLESSFSVSSQSAVIAEWNMNIPGNIQKLGNYRYRKNSTQYSALTNTFDAIDSAKLYTGATDADIVVESGLQEDGITPLLFSYTKDKEKLYYSLEDCLKPFRPRSGINKLSFFSGKYLAHTNTNMFLRPRYYMPTKDDEFKYWRSYRTESLASVAGVQPTSLTSSNIEYGISKNSTTGVYLIDDAVPFVAYKEEIPANRLVVKVQTNVGDIDLGPFKQSGASLFSDPFYGDSKKTTPQNFKVQYLTPNSEWVDAYSFSSTSLREDGASPIFKSDGYLSLEYGLKVPYEYKDNFILISTVSQTYTLPESNTIGSAYLVIASDTDKGTLHIYNGYDYDLIDPEYVWKVGEDGAYENTQFVTDPTNPSYFLVPNDARKVYREFVWIKGIRLVVESMNVPNAPLELIELSPRLAIDLTPKVIDFDITKTLSDLSSSSLPVGQLTASVGNLNLFDDDHAFNVNNAWNFDTDSGSIISKYVLKNVKVLFYEVIKNVEGNNYYVPIKTLYSEGIPQIDQSQGTISISLRDFYFYLESTKAPRILLTEVSLSQAICILLDSIGFSNYVFKRLANETDPIIPYFFIAPDQSVAEVLSQLATATQSAMFFDEYNNFVVMTKNYLLDDTGERSVDLTLYGSNDPVQVGINENVYTSKLPNIVKVASEDQKVYNTGTINYTSRYIQRSYGSLSQAQTVDKSWIYKPSLLWEVSGTEKTTTANAEKQEKFALSAMPLNTTLSDAVPVVSNGVLTNNIIDVGENAYFITRFTGLLYANSEIIKYDAVQHNITGVGNVWISNGLEYQKYFSELPFNGKIYPTGNLRIYAEPYYEVRSTDGRALSPDEAIPANAITTLKNGPVVAHGRGQFGTPIVTHNAGLDSYWSNDTNVQGCDMQSQYLYTTELNPTLPATELGAAGVSQARAQKSNRNGIIKNFLSTSFGTETGIASLKTTKSGTVQSSALVMTGPSFDATDVPRNFVSYVHKPLNGAFKHFGTRVRIIGKIEAAGDRAQSPVGGMTYFNVPNTDPTKTISVGGGSAGISLVNPATNNGYYFEIAALTSGNIDSLLAKDSSGNATVSVDNILFYKVKKETGTSTKAIPEKLWGGIGNILVDDGNFTGQYRITGEENPTVYDLSMEYVDIGTSTRVFYLYINQKLVKIVTDTSPMTLTNPSIGLFVRGTSKAMFENVYALSKNYASNAVFDTNTPIAAVFGDANNEVNASEALTKYAMSGTIQKTYLTGIKGSGVPDYGIYFEEFGTIMREAAYFNVKYDRAYPALYAKIAPTFNRLRGYTVSGFNADSYGAEFLVFNHTDTILNLDETTGNYLRIQGVTFTQDTTNTITVDDYFKKRGNLADPELSGQTVLNSPYKMLQDYDKIKISRLQYGKSEFNLTSNYIQDQDTAENILGWIISKNLRPRKSVGVEIFANPTIQLGDMVNINYKSADGIDLVTPETTKLIVYNISYKKSVGGPSMTIYLSEV